MTKTKLEKLSTQVDAFCGTSDAIFIFEEKTQKLIGELLKGAYEDPANKTDYIALIERIRGRCDCSERLMSATIGTIGYGMYDKNAPKLAESAFRIAVDICPGSSIRTNLAYVCRRHRDQLPTSDVEIIDLLFEGVKKRDPYCLINMALHFAQNLGREADWKLSDRIIGLLKSDESDISSAADWWKQLAEEDDDEGILVLCWLERHSKFKAPGDLREKFVVLQQRCPHFPQWIFEPLKKE